jgi:GNAT superfamily N-acetyltransferase
MELLQVQNKKDWEDFHKVPKIIYQQYPLWIEPLRADVEKAYQSLKDQNKPVGCWILKGSKGQLLGRICASINNEENSGISFFECVEDQKAADLLFDVAENFLKKQEVKHIDGPISLTERDKYWGLLTHGFDKPPVFQENYQPPYYLNFFKKRGYQELEKIYTLSAQTKDVPLERFKALALRIKERYGYFVKGISKKNLLDSAKSITSVYNKAFESSPNFSPIQPEVVLDMLKEVSLFIDSRICCIAFDGHKPIGFCALLPDMNPFIKGLGGKLSHWRLPVFLGRFLCSRQKTIKGVAFGIDPEYQSKGVYPLLVEYMGIPEVLEKYTRVFLATIRADNQLMVKTTMNLGVEIERIHYTFRKYNDI